MPIPPFNEHGWLPEGIHDCTLDEVSSRFGLFQESDQRPRLWAKFVEFLIEVRRTGLVRRVMLDGSFVTAKSDPIDIDLLLIVDADHDFPPVYDPANIICLHKNACANALDLI
jgi:hypothetical protein